MGIIGSGVLEAGKENAAYLSYPFLSVYVLLEPLFYQEGIYEKEHQQIVDDGIVHCLQRINCIGSRT